MKILQIPIILYIRNFPTIEKNSSYGLIKQLKIDHDILYNIFDRKVERDKLFNSLKKRFTYMPWCYLGFQSEKEVKLAKLGDLL